MRKDLLRVPAKTSFEVFAVIVHFKKEKVLHETVRNVLRFLDEDQICIVDNSETLDSSKFQHLLALPNPGFGAGMNVGVAYMRKRHSSAKYALLLSHETLISATDFERLLAALKENRNLGVVGPALYLPSGKVWSYGGLFNENRISPKHILDSRKSSYVDWIDGACLLVNLEMFTLVGGFDTDFVQAWEDVALGFQMRRLGKQMKVIKEAKAIQTCTGVPRTTAFRNNWVLSLKYHDTTHSIRLFCFCVVKISTSLLKFQFKIASEIVRGSLEGVTTSLKRKYERD